MEIECAPAVLCARSKEMKKQLPERSETDEADMFIDNKVPLLLLETQKDAQTPPDTLPSNSSPQDAYYSACRCAIRLPPKTIVHPTNNKNTAFQRKKRVFKNPAVDPVPTATLGNANAPARPPGKRKEPINKIRLAGTKRAKRASWRPTRKKRGWPATPRRSF